MVLPEVEKRCSGEADVAEIASTHRARRESHGDILIPRRHSLREILVFGSGKQEMGTDTDTDMNTDRHRLT